MLLNLNYQEDGICYFSGENSICSGNGCEPWDGGLTDQMYKSWSKIRWPRVIAWTKDRFQTPVLSIPTNKLWKFQSAQNFLPHLGQNPCLLPFNVCRREKESIIFFRVPNEKSLFYPLSESQPLLSAFQIAASAVRL